MNRNPSIFQVYFKNKTLDKDLIINFVSHVTCLMYKLSIKYSDNKSMVNTTELWKMFNYKKTRIFLSKSLLRSQNVVKYIEQSFALNATAKSALSSSSWWICELVTKSVFWQNIYNNIISLYIINKHAYSFTL